MSISYRIDAVRRDDDVPLVLAVVDDLDEARKVFDALRDNGVDYAPNVERIELVRVEQTTLRILSLVPMRVRKVADA